ncbi:MAG: GNAT family N-acetyltransferase [Sedimentisphaerales bacterium]|nr:GNAT family N-acetyltransferase [Sedimentisphaerales bacterium]
MSNNEKITVCNGQDDLVCSIFTSFQELSISQDEWDAFLGAVHGNIYLSYDWCRIWWNHYGKGRELRIFIFREQGHLVGIVPFAIDPVGFWPFRLRTAKILGSDFTMVIVNPPIHKKFAESIFNHVNAALLNHEHCDLVCWGPLSSNYYVAEAVQKSLETDSGDFQLIRNAALGNYSVFPLPATYDDYVSSLSKNTRKHYRRNQKMLCSEHHIEYGVDNTASGFDDFVFMHESQWTSIRKLGHFGDWPGAKEFHRDLDRVHSEHDRLRLFCLTADGKPIVYRYVYRFGKRYHSFLPARLCGAEWDKYGLGQLTHMMTVEKAMEEGIEEIEAGRGHYDHKLKLGGREFPVLSFVIGKRSFFGLLRGRLFCMFADCLHLMYYRIWFNRLAPKLPLKRRPLWKLWIRTRL